MYYTRTKLEMSQSTFVHSLYYGTIMTGFSHGTWIGQPWVDMKRMDFLSFYIIEAMVMESCIFYNVVLCGKFLNTLVFLKMMEAQYNLYRLFYMHKLLVLRVPRREFPYKRSYPCSQNGQHSIVLLGSS